MDRTSNNIVRIGEQITGAPEFSHEVFGEKFFILDLSSKRKSGVYDTVPVAVSDRAVDITDLTVGTFIYVTGSFRSFNKHKDGRNTLVLNVFANEVQFAECEPEINEIELKGCICKEPKERETPLGREIADVLVAVNRAYGKSDYIPCITWGRNAAYTAGLSVGTKLSCRGRIQSREYKKNDETRIAYEVSLSTITAE